jgi:hypothetical protein
LGDADGLVVLEEESGILPGVVTAERVKTALVLSRFDGAAFCAPQPVTVTNATAAQSTTFTNMFFMVNVDNCV